MMKNTMEYKPDIRKAMNAADELLLAALTVTAFPYSVIELIETTTDVQVRSFRYFRQRGINPLTFGSKDAIIFSYKGMVIMAYDNMAVRTRIRFSILHELGHFILGHNMDPNIPMALYKKQEVEAWGNLENAFYASMRKMLKDILEYQERLRMSDLEA